MNADKSLPVEAFPARQTHQIGVHCWFAHKKKVPVSFAQLPPPEQRAETMGASSEARSHPMPNDQVMDKKNKLAKVPRDVLKSMSNIGAKNYIKVG